MKPARRFVLLLCGGALAFGVSAGWGPATKQTSGTAKFAVRVDDSFKFQPDHFTCEPGAAIRMSILNALPAGGVDLPHNIVVLTADANVEAFSTAALQASPEHDYLPAAFAGQVLASSRLLHPGQAFDLRFTAPAQPGDYPIVCSFPGHCMLGMQGRLVVRTQP